MTSTHVAPATRHRLLRSIVDHARLAPSIHNTQPWRWVLAGDHLELWADRGRGLGATDPLGRSLVVSCGTSLHHAVVSAQALGLSAFVEHLPDSGRPELLARLAFEETPYREGDELYLEAIAERRTDRRRFTAWPVPAGRLTDLAGGVDLWGARALPVTDAALRFRAELLVEEALRVQLRDADVLAEESAWVDRGMREGIPRGALPPLTGAHGERRSRFASQVVEEPPTRRLGESTDGLIVVWTAHDGPLDWLHAGEALSAIWLRATLAGLSLVPLSQLIEVSRTRAALDGLLLQGRGHAQILARIGWQEIGRGTLVRTPRRTLEDVLVEVPEPAGPRAVGSGDSRPCDRTESVEIL